LTHAARRWLTTTCERCVTVTTDFGDRILPVTTEVCERWALLSVPDPLPVIDGLLTATALERDLVMVTRKVEAVSARSTHPARTGASADASP